MPRIKNNIASMRILLCGNLGQSSILANGAKANGQTIKTRQVYELLVNMEFQVDLINTSSRLSFIFSFWKFLTHRKILVIPGISAIRTIWPLLTVHQLLYGDRGTRVCVAVGGWLPAAMHQYFSVKRLLSSSHVVLVETQRMEGELLVDGVNTSILRNVRYLEAIPKHVFSTISIKLLFLSRVRLDKGIDKAVRVLECLRETDPRISLNVYGPIDGSNSEEIDKLLSTDGVAYHGIIDSLDSVIEIMANHDLLLFPSTYPGEGIPGVLVEALFAGLPSIATHWLDLPEIVDHGSTGYLFQAEYYVEETVRCIQSLNQVDLEAMSRACLERSKQYQPESGYAVLRQAFHIIEAI
jgi:glycosyltransferase involved in cell wall biosynthesis